MITLNQEKIEQFQKVVYRFFRDNGVNRKDMAELLKFQFDNFAGDDEKSYRSSDEYVQKSIDFVRKQEDVKKAIAEDTEEIIKEDNAPESEFEIGRQESNQIDDYTTRLRPLNDKGFPINYDDITEDDIPGDREAFKKEAKTYGSFTMSPVEYLRLKQFRKDHHDCRVGPDGFSRFGAIGGGTVVSFVGTGLGPIVHVKCEHCGTEVDLTDSDSW